MSSKANKALTPSGMNHRIHLEGVTYSDYIHESAELIRAGRVDLSGASPEKIQKYVNANAPSESRPSVPTRDGILLVHGLTGSPMGMSSLHRYFADRHYLVRSLLLPGHGTRPGDLLDITYQDCLDTCRFGIRTLREEVDHVSVIGFSAGSALAIYLAQTEASIDNLVLLAPALALNNPFSSLYASLLYPFRRWFPNVNWPILNKEEGKASKTIFELVKNFENACWVKANPLTGRTHQIRVHAAEIGHPVLGDEKYGRERSKACPRLCLHARALKFTLPESQKTCYFEAPIDEKMQKFILCLERNHE